MPKTQYLRLSALKQKLIYEKIMYDDLVHRSPLPPNHQLSKQLNSKCVFYSQIIDRINKQPPNKIMLADYEINQLIQKITRELLSRHTNQWTVNQLRSHYYWNIHDIIQAASEDLYETPPPAPARNKKKGWYN